ncbi:hypothetical protein GGI09_004711 [Coemansia sp. S100]|nr:hypothetical protein GGI09_004711 [Coemansia sp. S100]KAJ2108614.1 hypothetical protein GGI16_001062 [Coemansia sp. S142-1]
MNSQTEDTQVHVIFRFPFKRPEGFQPPQLAPASPLTLEEQVWRCLISLPGPDRPQDILAELEQDQVTFDWELLASTLQVPLSDVFVAASNLFQQHIGRPLTLVEDSVQMLARHSARTGSEEVAEDAAYSQQQKSLVPRHELAGNQSQHSSLDEPANTRDFEQAGLLQSVESLGNGVTRAGSSSPVVELDTATPDDRYRSRYDAEDDSGRKSLPGANVDSDLSMRTAPNPVIQHSYTSEVGDDDGMRQSLIAEAMASRVHHPSRHGPREQQPHTPAAATAGNTAPKQKLASSSSSFSDLSNSSLTESAMQDALISEAMNASTAMSSLLGSRMFPWSKKR